MSGGVKTFMVVGGLALIVLAILDMLDIPPQIPTKSNAVNLGIGVVLVATPFFFRKVAR